VDSTSPDGGSNLVTFPPSWASLAIATGPGILVASDSIFSPRSGFIIPIIANKANIAADKHPAKPKDDTLCYIPIEIALAMYGFLTRNILH
jgi:hypothetical protein